MRVSQTCQRITQQGYGSPTGKTFNFSVTSKGQLNTALVQGCKAWDGEKNPFMSRIQGSAACKLYNNVFIIQLQLVLLLNLCPEFVQPSDSLLFFLLLLPLVFKYIYLILQSSQSYYCVLINVLSAGVFCKTFLNNFCNYTFYPCSKL